MRSLFNRFLQAVLGKLGYTIYSRSILKYYSTEELKEMYSIKEQDAAYIRGKLGVGLKERLLEEKKNRWLEIGCGGNFEENFHYVDTFPEGVVCEKDKYFRANAINMSEADFERMGKFDFIRMQHVFEHFTPEDGLSVLNNCARLLNPDGYILITTPDLKKYVHLYLSGKINENFDWALNRVEKDSPNSFFFSVFSHSLLHESHLWCYDAEGLIYQFERTGKFKNIRELTLNDELANIPFTHNRPNEDVCVLAQAK